MRVYRPSYTMPRPAGCRVLDRADGRYVRYRDKHGREIVARLSKSGKRIVLETKEWHCQFRDTQDIERTLPVDPDEGATRRIGDTIQDLLSARAGGGGIDKDLRRRLEGLPARIRQSLSEWGLLDEKAGVATKLLTELIAMYADSLKARERTGGYVWTTASDVKAVCEACGFRRFSDIDPVRVESYLKQRRDDGISYRRSNAILLSIKQFAKWMVTQRYVSESPIAHLSFLDEEQDRRRVRRVLEVEDLQRLLAVTRQGPMRYKVSGYERYLVYRVACETGLRRGEIKALTVGAFHWDTLTIELDPSRTKNRQGGTLPIRPDLAAELQAYLADKVPTAKAFWLPHDVSAMLQADLADAGILYRDEAGRVFDFHSLRHQFGTLLSSSGVAPKVAQELMRHGDINLTMSLYSHVLRDQPSKAVAALPDLNVGQPRAAKTGTDGREEILRFSYAAGGLPRTPTDLDGSLAAPKPRLDAGNEPAAAMDPP